LSDLFLTSFAVPDLVVDVIGDEVEVNVLAPRGERVSKEIRARRAIVESRARKATRATPAQLDRKASRAIRGRRAPPVPPDQLVPRDRKATRATPERRVQQVRQGRRDQPEALVQQALPAQPVLREQQVPRVLKACRGRKGSKGRSAQPHSRLVATGARRRLTSLMMSCSTAAAPSTP
jgi:hypothetical protein